MSVCRTLISILIFTPWKQVTRGGSWEFALRIRESKVASSTDTAAAAEPQQVVTHH